MINADSGAPDVIDDDGENFTVDFGAVPDAKREVIPKADYNVVIAELEFRMSEASNKPMWAVVLEIEDGDYAGRKLYTNLSFSEKALPLTKGSIKAFAPDILEAGAFNPKQIADQGELLGRKARVRTKITLYQGEKQTQVARWMPALGDTNAFLG